MGNLLNKLKAALAAIGAKIKSVTGNFLVRADADIKDLWERDKGFLIAFGIIILTIKFRNILIDLIVRNAASIFRSAEKTNDALQKKEDANNAAADKLVQQANQLPDSEKPVSEDWYENK